MKKKLANLRKAAPSRKGVILPAVLPPLGLFVFCMLLTASVMAATATEAAYWWPYSVSLWLVIHQVPFYGIGPTGYLTVVGLLPLLPTIGYVALLAWTARTFTHDEQPKDTQLYSGIAVVTPLLIGLLSWITLRATAAQIFVQPPHPLALFGFVLATTLIGLCVGLRGRVLHIIPNAKEKFPSWGTEGFRLAGRLAALLLFFGSLAALISILVHWRLLGDVLLYGTSAAGILSFGFLTLLYLPNMAVAAAIILSGGGIQIGTTHASLYSTNISELPALPIFAALPQGKAQWWWLVFLIVPIISTILASKDVHGDAFSDRVKATLFGAITTASLFAVGAWVTGGSIGVMGRVTMSEALIGLVMAVWILVIGMATVFSTSGPRAESWDSYQKRRAKERRQSRATAVVEDEITVESDTETGSENLIDEESADQNATDDDLHDGEPAEEVSPTAGQAPTNENKADPQVDLHVDSETSPETSRETGPETDPEPEKSGRESPADGLD